MDSIVFGPGLGREEDFGKIFITFSNKITELESIPLIYDADGIYFYSKYYKELKINNNLILTPNNTEFVKLCNELGEKFNIERNKELYNKIEDLIKNNKESIFFIDLENQPDLKDLFINEINICHLFNNCILVKKGKYDVITNGKLIYIVHNNGCLKRTGGIGDILGGFINSYCGMWSKKCKIEKIKLEQEDLIQCCVLACYFCRKYSNLAYEKKLYSLTAPDIIHCIDGNYN